MREVKIGTRLIGETKSCFIIAEAGVNHNGSLDLAKKMIDVAKDTGADAVKFQSFKAENVLTKNAKKAGYQKSDGDYEESQYEMIKKLELKKEDFKELSDYAGEKNIVFLSSPFDMESVDMLYELDVPAFKIPSGEITNLPFLRYIAKKKKPIILSTEMAKLGEVEEAVNIIKNEGVEDIVILHCVTDYPAYPEEANLNVLRTLRYAFGFPVGFSDHTLSLVIPAVAFSLGACVVEKHFTLDRNLPGPDHRASLEPGELKRMIDFIRETEKALGDGIKRPTIKEEEIKKLVRKSIVAKSYIPRGTVIRGDMLAIKRPGTGIEPRYIGFIVGRKAKQDIEKDELVWTEKIE